MDISNWNRSLYGGQRFIEHITRKKVLDDYIQKN
jgi:hypothetical protein